MKKTITITLHDRPEYSERLLQSLVRADLSGWKVFCSIEPTAVRNQQLNLIAKYIPDAEVILNTDRLGVNLNPFYILNKVFQEGSELNLYLEEDIIISPDSCSVADWFSLKDLDKKYLCLCLGNRGVTLFSYQDKADSNPSTCMLTPRNGAATFNAIGVVITEYRWYNDFKPHWLDLPDTTWDHSINRHIIRNDMKVITPYISRSDHIGDHGINVTNSQHNLSLGWGQLELAQTTHQPFEYWIL